MKAMRTSSLEELRAASSFESLRETLHKDRYTVHLEKPLAYWTLPTDRRLPLVLLGRTVRDLIETPFSEIAATRGIGKKKIRAFVGLLSRVANTDPEELVSVAGRRNGNGATPKPAAPVQASDLSNGFDLEKVSEVVWAQWRATVVRHHLEGEPLGRLTPSLQSMTRAGWHTPLGEYTDKTLAQIQAMRTHGEKRVRAIVEVFYCVHEITAEMGTLEHLAVRILPRRIEAIEHWVHDAVHSESPPDHSEIHRCLIQPILDQLRNDAPSQVVRMAENRLGLAGPITSVREAARTLGLTRARVYQVLNEISDIFDVRWPTGRGLLHGLFHVAATTVTQDGHSGDLTLLRAAAELLYPQTRRNG